MWRGGGWARVGCTRIFPADAHKIIPTQLRLFLMNIRSFASFGFILAATLGGLRAQLLPGRGTGLEADANTVALFRFEDPAGTALDSAGGNRHATPEGTTSVSGLFGNGRSFNGVSDRLELGAVGPALSGSAGWTIEYFAKAGPGGSVPYFVNHNASAGWTLKPAGSQILYWIKTSASGNGWLLQESAVAPALDTAWHYYALTWKSGGALSIYRDGELLGATNAAGSWGGSATTGVWLNFDSYSSTYGGAGVVDEIRFSNIARSAAEILAAYNKAATGDASGAAVPQLINYQGRVAVGGTAFDGTGRFKFALVNSAGALSYWSNDQSSATGNEPTAAIALPVVNGLYSVLLGDTALANMAPIPASVFAHPYVRLRVWFNDGVNGFQLLTPDQRIAAVGYAMMAADVPDGAITAAKLAPGAVTGANLPDGAITAAKLADGSVTAAKLAAGAVSGSSLADGSITAAKLAPGVVGTFDTTGSAPLDFKVNGQRALRLFDPGDSADSGTEPDGAPNIIGGAAGNSITAGTVGSTIAGGGAGNYFGAPFYNSIAADFSFVGGGYGNAVQAGARFGFIGAGRFNAIQTDSLESVISGGVNNAIQANAFRAVIGGGEANTIQTGSLYSTIAGGYSNSITGGYAFVAGGEANAAGSGSFAAGHRAKATHFGSFVWADSTDVDFSSTANKQFSVRAGGGARFETAGAGITVDGVKLKPLTWQVVAGTIHQATSNTGYIATNGSAQVSLVLPASPEIGDILRISGGGRGGWKLVLNGGQTVVGAGVGSSDDWTPRTTVEKMANVASSADGTKLVAVGSSTRIYTSTDSGVTWVARDAQRYWQAVALSADGSKLVAGIDGGGIYVSTDAGVTWTLRGPAGGNRIWEAFAFSTDGSKLVAMAHFGETFTSTDDGVTWVARASAPNCYALTSSADGTKLAAAGTGFIYTSTDFGANWTQRESSRSWSCISSSADGNRLVAAVRGGHIYTSTDAGVSWIPRESSRDWRSVTSSSDGNKLAAAANGGQIYLSIDGGVSWKPQDSSRNWTSIASSGDGNKLVAAANGGLPYQLYTSQFPAILSGGWATAAELQYIGNGQFLLLSHEGALSF